VKLILSSSVNQHLVSPYLKQIDSIGDEQSLPDALAQTHMALAASGTVTLSCALWAIPTVVAYKGSLLNEFLYRKFIPYKGPISLANIVHQNLVFPELLQDDASSFNLAMRLKRWLTDQKEYEKIKDTLLTTQSLLRGEDLSVSSYMAGVIRENGHG
jgi:lipid-A-disaccharide synthase